MLLIALAQVECTAVADKSVCTQARDWCGVFDTELQGAEGANLSHAFEIVQSGFQQAGERGGAGRLLGQDHRAGHDMGCVRIGKPTHLALRKWLTVELRLCKGDLHAQSRLQQRFAELGDAPQSL
ncbi:hypothetical protein CC207_25650 [Pseudomonas sp. DrBHI1]|nr:hypothetical protein CC207_25650 [Pseudomonas sp. DrBHI1]